MDENVIVVSTYDRAYKRKYTICTIILIVISVLMFVWCKSIECIIMILMAICLYGMIHFESQQEIIISDKRVRGKYKMGVRFDIPLDSVSSISTGIWKTISIASSSGRITLSHVENFEEIYNVVNNLLQERQNESNASQSNADELIKYKKLFDEGVITQEEFDAKKKQLLGL